LNIEKSLSFLQEIKIENKKALQRMLKGWELSELPLLDRFRTFKGDMLIDNIKLNQLVFQ